MERLPDPELVPTSQEGGNMIGDNSPAMTAPGSDPVTPLPRPVAGENPGPHPPGPQVPVSTQKQPSASPPGGGGRWKYTPASGRS